MRQYFDIKNQFPDALVLFQVGDFYELFFDDAHKASAFLGIVLTQRGTLDDKPIPLCGVPRHTVDHYLVKLVKGGFRVVLCDQLEAAQAGKLVQRGVTQVLTPGTLTDTKLLDIKSAQYIGALYQRDGTVGILFYEMLSGLLYLTQCAYDEKKIDAELCAFMPQEILLVDDDAHEPLARICKQRMFITTPVTCTDGTDYAAWKQELHFVGKHEADITPSQQITLHMLASYLKKHAPHSFQAPKTLMLYDAHEYLQLDAATQKNLELVVNSYDATPEHSLLQLLDEAVTGMGSRLLKKWLLRPLRETALIEQRLSAVEYFLKNTLAKNEVRDTLKKIGDLERIVGRMALQRATIGDYRALQKSIAAIPALQTFCTIDIQVLTRLYSFLDRALNVDEQSDYKIARGYHEELDRLRQLATQGMQAILELERAEQTKTGIGTLKIRFTQQGGYAIELSKGQADQAPHYFIKLQSLTNRDRFTTQELKDLEYDINRAQASSIELENELFAQLIKQVYTYVPLLRTLCMEIAMLDAQVALAHVAQLYQWVRPQFTQQSELHIVNGRHPIVERRMRIAQAKQSFVPNDVHFDLQQRTWIITGPNMGGKSTFLRQVAVISILAQAGSFVPASAAVLPILDRIFTRIGAGDNMGQGKSTFLVEMEETALICKQATGNSLVILDEVGRGTSTYDGLALAHAIVEYLHQEIKPFCLFATHYHELTTLAQTTPGIVCYHAASKPVGDTVILLHKIMPGVAQGSFGIQVAHAAHLPKTIISRAKQLLHSYHAGMPNAVIQPALVIEPDARFTLLETLDLEAISPRQAYDILCKLKEIL